MSIVDIYIYKTSCKDIRKRKLEFGADKKDSFVVNELLLFRLTITGGTVIWSRCQNSVILSTIFTKYPGFSSSDMHGQSSLLTEQSWNPVLPHPPPVLLPVLSLPYQVHHPPVYHGLHRVSVPAHRAERTERPIKLLRRNKTIVRLN